MAKKNDKGWVKLHRKVQDGWLWMSDEPFDRRSAWIDLILMVNHEDRKVLIEGKLIIIGAGQRWISVRSLAERWHWSKNRVTRFLKLLERDSMIRLDGTPNGTLLTLINYSFFQTGRDTNGHTNGDTCGDTDGDTVGTKQELIRTNNKNERRISGSAASSSLSGRVFE